MLSLTSAQLNAKWTCHWVFSLAGLKAFVWNWSCTHSTKVLSSNHDTHTGSYMGMQTTDQISILYHDNIPVNGDSLPLPLKIISRCGVISKSYHLSVCPLSFGTTLIRFLTSPPTHIQSATKHTLRYFTHTHTHTYT